MAGVMATSHEGRSGDEEANRWRCPVLTQRLLLVALITTVAGCSQQEVKFDSKAMDRTFTARTREVLAGADRVEVFRLDGDNGPFASVPKVAGERRIGGFLVLKQGQDQGKAFATRLNAILASEATYSNHYAKCFNPGVAFRVCHREECVDVLLCFKCGNFYAGPPTDKAMETASFGGSPSRSLLVGLAQEAFPDDSEIQGLGATRFWYVVAALGVVIGLATVFLLWRKRAASKHLS